VQERHINARGITLLFLVHFFQFHPLRIDHAAVLARSQQPEVYSSEAGGFGVVLRRCIFKLHFFQKKNTAYISLLASSFWLFAPINDNVRGHHLGSSKKDCICHIICMYVCLCLFYLSSESKEKHGNWNLLKSREIYVLYLGKSQKSQEWKGLISKVALQLCLA
jgi:hypothetical protein